MIVNFVREFYAKCNRTVVHTSSMPLLLSTTQRQSDLRDQIHCEFVNRPFQFQKRSPLFIGMHNETLSVAAMRVNNPDRSPVEDAS
jgi:hypothetical protein